MIDIQDLNDNKPILTATSYTGTISENLPVGSDVTVVPKIFASDADAPQNSVITYNLHGEHNMYFSIDAVTGNVYCSIKLDRETQREYMLIVRASDNGNLFTEANLTIRVLDENDNTPRFEYSQYNVSISEGMIPSRAVIPLSASDADEGQNAKMKYSVQGGEDMFAIDEQTGNSLRRRLI